MKKILLVDDVEFMLQMEKSFFRGIEGVEILTAKDGIEALQVIEKEMPDMVFLDLIMPLCDGDECCYLIKKHQKYRNIRVFMVTASTCQSDIDRCRTCGADGILFKPLQRKKFVEALESLYPPEQRVAERHQARLCIRYSWGGRKVLSDYSVNLSTGGLFLESSNLLPAGTSLDVEFILPTGRRSVRCKARVAWLNTPEAPPKPVLPAGMGLQFLDLTVNDMDAIRGYLHQGRISPTWSDGGPVSITA
ncbi:MAG TPA: response regulator [Verrucomicrobiae bacterium]|nr:response regulator [Verrucomicrobiae bacterium]